MSNNLAANVTKEDILKAKEKIVKENIELRDGTKFSVDVEGVLFPPKEIIRVAAKIKGLEPDNFNLLGGDCNKYLERMGFLIVEKNKNELTKKFIDIIEQFKARILTENTKLKLFSINKVRNAGENDFVWVGDHKNIIKGGKYHYEIIRNETEILLELHFEDSHTKDLFFNKIGNLPDDLSWINWFKSKSIKLNVKVDLFAETTVDLLIEYLLKFDELIGEEVRSIILQINNTKDKMKDSEKLFIRYRDFLNEKRKNEIKSSTLSSYVDTAKSTIPKFWNEINKTDFENFRLIESDIEILKEIRVKKKQAFWGSGSFWNFINLLIINEESHGIKNENNLNQILYGPPGTGKTFALSNLYFNKFQTEIKNDIVNTKLNAIEKIPYWKLILYYLYKKGSRPVTSIVKDELLRLKHSGKKVDLNSYVWGDLLARAKDGSTDLNDKYRLGVKIFEKDKNSNWSVDNKIAHELFSNDIKRIEEIANLSEPEIKHTKLIVKRYKFVTFHQSFSYEDFVEGIKPFLKNEEENSLPAADSRELNYEMKKGVFYDLCLKGIKEVGYDSFEDCYSDTKENRINKFKSIENDLDKSYAIFIDEINRGNVSAIFGELISLIENDKRIGKDNELWVELPYSKTIFGVPPNLYIFGTMNTADRSIEALDTALRRRFYFQELMPKTELISPSAIYCKLLWEYESVGWENKEFKTKEDSLFELLGVSEKLKKERFTTWDKMIEENNRTKLTYFDNYEYNGVNLKEILDVINKRIEILIDRDHMIGHSYFMKICSIDDLKNVFKNNIIPLLQEYFYGDYGKIGLVLGEGFVDFVQSKDNTPFANLKGYQDASSLQKDCYVLKILDNDFNILEAFKSLLNKNDK